MTPEDKIVIRNLRPEYEVFLKPLYTLVEKCVDVGSNILKQDIPKKENVIELPATMLFRQFLEIVDAISILVKHSSIDSCKLLLRACLEIWFNLEYMLEKECALRSNCFMFMYHLNNFLELLKTDPNTEVGKAFYSELFENDKIVMRNIENINYSSTIERYMEIINSVELESIKKEAFQILEQKNYKNSSRQLMWYSLFQGPKSFYKLSKYLKKATLYQFHYSEMSKVIHGRDVFFGRIRIKNDKVEIMQLRRITDVQDVVQYCISYCHFLFKLFIEKRNPSFITQYNEWYATIREQFEDMTKRKLFFFIEE